MARAATEHLQARTRVATMPRPTTTVRAIRVMGGAVEAAAYWLAGPSGVAQQGAPPRQHGSRSWV